MTITTLRSFDADMKDIYPLPGTRIKQWVVALRANSDWEREACPYVDGVPLHNDDSGLPCSNHGRVQWRILDDHECQFCRDVSEDTAKRADVDAFLREAGRRSAEVSAMDKSLLSDEVQEDFSLRDSPLFQLVRKR